MDKDQFRIPCWGKPEKRSKAFYVLPSLWGLKLLGEWKSNINQKELNIRF